jgi:mono/diheme cytochrome c family protein
MAIRVILLTSVLVLAGFAGAMSVAPAQTPPARDGKASGAQLYKAFCASCHGETGKGDGPAADLSTPRAPDLTMIQRKAGGTFPRAQLLGRLDGTNPPKGHEAQMPNWRNVLRRTEGDDERVIQKRLEELVSHVEALQVRN